MLDQSGVYGEQGVADEENVPGARYDAGGFVDPSNNIYVFGGSGYANGQSGNFTYIDWFVNIENRFVKRSMEV